MIVIIDYGVGNVGSVHNMLRRIGAKARISGNPADMEEASKLILPGVGHFGHGMRSLERSGLVPALRHQALERRKPVLGICLGMQMLTRGSEESEIPGLGWIDAFTHRFSNARGLRVPHMGWNNVRATDGARLFVADAAEPERFYFVHSYYVKASRPAEVAAHCCYGDEFAAAIQSDNLFGVQFHPEKSHLFGMDMLRRFALL
jgi:glutamine amidotransferase